MSLASATAQGPPPAQTAGEPARFQVPLALRAPIQVTLACAIALGAGLLLSPTRWYWAVITAFIVFNNARSRADTTMRALQRTSGTIAGFFAGTVIATLVQGDLTVSIVGILLLFFVGVYFLQVSYGLMIFCVTIALALLYGVMGMFTPELLLVRLEETVAGGLAGAGVAFLVFPARASVTVAATLDTFLTALGELVAGARRRAHGEKPARGLLTLSRAVDRSYVELATSARPIGGPWSVVTRFGQVREKLLLLAGCAHWSRALARSMPPGTKLDSDGIARFDVRADQVAAQIAVMEASRAVFFERQRAIGPSSPAVAPPAGLAAGEDDPAYSLETIAALLAHSGARGGR